MLLIEEIFRANKQQQSDAFNLRIQRGLSWLKKSYDFENDLDLKFMSLWVSFNAIYAQDFPISQDKQSLKNFLDAIWQQDTEQKIDQHIWQHFHQPILVLLNNPYIFQGFWDYQNQKITHERCKLELEQEKKTVDYALIKKDTVGVLFILFQRLYTLRNQILQGGATYNSSLNRKQLFDSCQILAVLLPIFIQVLLENAQTLDVGKPYYPVVQYN